MMMSRVSTRFPFSALCQSYRFYGSTVAKHRSVVTKTLKSPRQYQSTIEHSESQDFSSVALRRDDADYFFEAHADAMSSAVNTYREQYNQRVISLESLIDEPQVSATAHEMDLIEAAHAAHDYESYDKIFILMRHGEAKHHQFQREFVKKHGKSIEESKVDEDYPIDPMLTGKGCGQMLALSRRTATFFNNETGLHPDLFVVSPLRRAIQSAIIAFPTHTAYASLKNTPWICNPLCMEQVNGNKSKFVSSPEELEEIFAGVNFDMFKSLVGADVSGLNFKEKVPVFENMLDLKGRTDEFLRWVKQRDERVIVVSSHATWLHSLCEFSLQYQTKVKGQDMFKKGEMRSVGIKFI